MARRNRHRLEDDEDDEVTADEIEELELEAVVWYLRRMRANTVLTRLLICASLLQLAADKKLNTIIAWLKHKYPIGGCTIHPTEHCFFNKLGHWNLDLYKLFVWAVEIVSFSSCIHRRYSNVQNPETPQGHWDTPPDPRPRLLG